MRRLKSLSRAVVLGLALAAASSASAAPAPQVHVPPGFVAELVAGEPLVKYPMFAVFDDSGRLFVAESSGLDLYNELQAQTRKCRIRLLEDRDDDGRFETSRVFADKLVYPMGLAWRDGKLYVADPPDLIVCEDTDGDGVADERTVILTGFGHRDNGSLHGLIFGPDGWLYMTMGSPDGYRLRQADGAILAGESGALIRCRPDGSDPEVLCRGFENLVEVAFTPRGEIFGTVNWFRDVNKPRSEGLRDALVHLVEGALYPFHRDSGTPKLITGDPLGPMSLFPAVALSGIVRYEGTTFPAEYRGNLFSAQHNTRKVGRHVVVPHGSTFLTENLEFLSSEDPDFHPSDVLEDADGSLLVVDTGSWYVQHCPTGRIRETYAPGGIYRVRAVAAQPPDDPWGKKEDWSGLPVERLIELLDDERPAVRARAHQALAALGESATARLVEALQRTSDVAAQQRIVWTLAAIGDEPALSAIRSALDGEDDVAATAARALAAHNDPHSENALEPLLNREAPHVRLAAAEALAHCGNRQTLPKLWQVLAGEPDRFLEHAAIHAAHRLAKTDDLQEALASEHSRVQKAALLLLNQPPRSSTALSREAVLTRVAADDPDLRGTAVQILQEHSAWTDAAVALVRTWLWGPAPADEDERRLREMILALETEPAMQEIVASALTHADGGVSPAQRVNVLRTLAQSGLPSPPESWVRGILAALDDVDPEVRDAAIQTAVVWNARVFDDALAQAAHAGDASADLRLASLAAIVARRPELEPGLCEWLLRQLTNDAEPLARLRAVEILAQARLSESQLRDLLDAAAGEALISPSLLLPVLERSTTESTAERVIAFLEDALDHGWRPAPATVRATLDSLPVPAARAARLLQRVDQVRAATQTALAGYEPLLLGGNAARGREVFYGSKVACASCHRVGNEGGSVGPDLTRIGTVRSGRDLIESIAVPSSTFAQGYETYLVTTTSGRMLTGTLASQTAGVLVLRDSGGALHRVVRDDVETIDRAEVSLMPDGLVHALTPEEFQNVLAFLQTLK